MKAFTHLSAAKLLRLNSKRYIGNVFMIYINQLTWSCGGGTEFLFFTNVPNIPTDIDGVDLNAFFKKLGVEVVQMELTNQTPKDWHGAWRNQFYLFDVLQYLSEHKFDKDNNFLILDSDCVIRKDISPVFEDIKKKGIIAYDCGYLLLSPCNGINLQDMRNLYEEYYNENADELVYYGGEFIGVNASVVPYLVTEYKELWKKNYIKYEQHGKKLTEEAHFLSTLYYHWGLREAIANKYIDRMWTAIRYDTINQSQRNLTIWHIPSEKDYGFVKLFDWFKKHQNPSTEDFLKISENLLIKPSNKWLRRMKRMLNIFAKKYLK